ncbi:MmgE/PrpD family protein [Candidimonas nitroreducens]|uniref:MmgE/PrpD family protein n=1 Tax=Candidimonas nitroreducens TaxID=683354 RepID=UPI001303818B|nr:MmgE/PrpD family protein [Candidimonas nitroreducens]
MSSLSSSAAKWFLALSYDDLPVDIVEETHRAILNTIAVATAASVLEYGSPVCATAKDLGGIGSAHLFGSGEKTSASAAAFANATMSAALAYDDSHTETLIHVYGTIVSTVLALAQQHAIDGKEVLTVVAGASELTCRIGMIAPTAFHRNGLHPTGIIGAFGAAYAAARLLRLSYTQTVHAIGIVGNLASGINQCWVDGTWSQLLDNGWAAQAGITAATIARHGYTGPSEVLEGKLGLFRSHIQQPGYPFDFDCMIHDLGTHWEMREIEIKPYPCGHVSQPFVDCALSLYRRGLKHEDIASVTCLVSDWMVPVVCEPLERKRRPTTAWHGRVSLPYTIAETLWFGRLDAESYRSEYLASRELLELADRVSYEIDTSVRGGRTYKGWVRVTTHDGRLLEEIKSEEDSCKHMPREVFLDKIRCCLRTGGIEDRHEALVAAVERLNDASSIVEVMAACDPTSSLKGGK